MRQKMLRYFSALVLVGLIATMAFMYFPETYFNHIVVIGGTTLQESGSNLYNNLNLDVEKSCEELKIMFGMANDSFAGNVSQAEHERLFVIVAFRDREEHKVVFMNEMTTYLKQKNLDFRIMLVEQSGKDPFNRAKLMNVGVVEALKELLNEDIISQVEGQLTPGILVRLAQCHNLQACFVFHDIDMIPENLDIPYNCSQSPILFATSVQQFGYKLPYQDYFGGVTAISLQHFMLINGYPNRYWGWGGEDDDIYGRCKYKKLNPQKLDLKIGRFKSQSHRKRASKEEFSGRFSALKKAISLMDKDGVRQVEFNQMNTTEFPQYKHVLVDLLYEKLS